MLNAFYIAFRYLAANKLRSFILVICLTIGMYLPITSNLLVNFYQQELKKRADETPMIAGAPGSRFDLTLHSLYFIGKTPHLINLGIEEKIESENLASVIPIYCRYHAKGFPIVGTSIEYFTFRKLGIAKGDSLVRLGDCLLGAKVAKKLKVKPGDYIMSDPENIFDISGSFPVSMRVQGVLNSNGTPDDNAIFTDVKTVWLLQGVMHGHAEIAIGTTLGVSNNNKIANASVKYFSKVTDSNITSFHFHCKHNKLPISSLIIIPNDTKSGTILQGRYIDKSSLLQIVIPNKVIDELLRLIFKIKKFFDLNMLFIAVITTLFLALILILSMKIRESEMSMMFKLGCSQEMVVYLQMAEVAILLSVSLLISSLSAGITIYFVKLYLFI